LHCKPKEIKELGIQGIKGETSLKGGIKEEES
jgi:hypothetical protein